MKRQLLDYISSRFWRCIEHIIVSSISSAEYKYCLEVFKERGIIDKILLKEQVRVDVLVKALRRRLHGERVPLKQTIRKCLDLLPIINECIERCRKWAIKPIKCIEMEMSFVDPDEVEKCWEMIEKEHPPIQVI